MENFFWGIIAGAVIVLIAFLIPAILQITRTVRAAEDLIKSTQASLNPLLLKLNETIDRTNKVAAEVAESVRNVQHLTKAVGETGALIDELNHFVRQVGVFLSAGSSGLVAGIKAAFAILTKGAVEKITSSK
jgi:uncharacterized protein YoxC